MKSLPLYLDNPSRRLLILLIVAHILGTIVAYTIYIRLSSLGDGYAVKDFAQHLAKFSGDLRELGTTLFVHGIYAYLGAFLPSFLAPMALGVVVAIATWYAFRGVYTQINRKLFWTCNLLPHYLIWSGSSSKEQIVIIFGIIVIGFAAKHSFGSSRLSVASLFFVFLSLGIILWIRPNYFVIYFTIFVTSLFAPVLHKIKIYRLSIGIWTFVFFFTVLWLMIFAFFHTTFFSKDVIVYMSMVERYFLSYEAGSNRYNIQWETISDFIYNSLWGIPQGFIGPTLFEAISKPVQFPVFLEGVVYLCILCFLFVRLFILAAAFKMLRVHIIPYYLIALSIIFVSYPFLIFNAGSALRYKQSMHPILIFYPLLILGYAKANNLIRKKL